MNKGCIYESGLQAVGWGGDYLGVNIQIPISLEYSNIPELFQYSKFQYWERSELGKGKHEIEASPSRETNYPISVGLAHERVPFCFRAWFGIEVAVV